MKSTLFPSVTGLLAVGLFAALAVVPFVSAAIDEPFWTSFFARILIYGIAASALNLALGYGGLVSFGHALFLGLGVYAVALPANYGISSGFLHAGIAVVVCGAVALAVGTISLRTSGMAFIMITLAFAQMIYYLTISIKAYGGDDGLSLAGRSQMPWVDIHDDTTFYYVVLAVCVASLYALARVLNARFGHVLQAIRDNEVRMQALGYAVYRYKLVAFVMAGALAGLAGALLANQGGFVSPALMQWSQSGLLMMMVILGGVGHLYGGVWGAVVFLLLEETLSHFTIHWQLGLGALLLAVVLLAPNGLTSVLQRLQRKDAP